MFALKQALIRTRIFRLWQRLKLRRQFQRWTPHDEAMRRLYSQFLRPGDLCFDIGANVGQRTKVFARLCGTVVAVEPQAHCLALLRILFGDNPRVRLVPKAVGAAEGSAEMAVSNAHTLSSLAPEWVDAVRRSGRFGDTAWDQKQTVPLTTLDRLIDEFGMPAFIKIDVEGYEYQVLSGLTRPVRCLSFEFTPEVLDAAFRCIGRLAALGRVEWNYALDESMQLVLDPWEPAERLRDWLAAYRPHTKVFGDVYARFLPE